MDESNINKGDGLDPELLEKVIDLGKLNYPVSKCLNVLQLSGDAAEEFERLFYIQGSSIQTKYQIGMDLADFELDTKILVLAKAGDLKAVKEYDTRRKIYHEMKKQEAKKYLKVQAK